MIALTMVVAGIILCAVAMINSILEFEKVKLFDPIFCIIASVGLITILAGVVLRITGDRKIRRMRIFREKHRVNLDTIVLSYAMVNKTPRKNLKDLHFYLLSEGVADISLKRLRAMVNNTLTNIRMDKIKPSLMSKLFTDDGKLRRYRFASDYCPKCGVFKNYHKECGFCGYHEMSK